MRLLCLILLFVTKFSNAQEFTISGKVFDSNANVLAEPLLMWRALTWFIIR